MYTGVDNRWTSTYYRGHRESQIMPNQRDPNKKQLTIWRYEKDMDVLREVAKQNGISMSELMEILIEDFQDKRKAQQKSFLRNKRK